MPAFYLLLLLGVILLFFLLAFIYKPLGNVVNHIFGDAIKIMTEEEKENENE